MWNAELNTSVFKDRLGQYTDMKESLWQCVGGQIDNVSITPTIGEILWDIDVSLATLV